MAKRKMTKPTTAAILATGTSTELEEVVQGVTVVARSVTKRCNATDRCGVCGGRDRSAKLCANIVTVFACESDASGSDSDGVSAEKYRTLLSAIQQARFSTSLVQGEEMRSLGRWGISQ